MNKINVGLAAVGAGASLMLAPVANADDAMYRVGTDIVPGDYRYTVVGNGMGSWELCTTAQCDVATGMIDMDTIDGMGATGYLTVPSSAKFVKTNDLLLSRLS
jgi:hypothetical protein